MVIFHSYVSLPEGKWEMMLGRRFVQRLYHCWGWSSSINWGLALLNNHSPRYLMQWGHLPRYHLPRFSLIIGIAIYRSPFQVIPRLPLPGYSHFASLWLTCWQGLINEFWGIQQRWSMRFIETSYIMIVIISCCWLYHDITFKCILDDTIISDIYIYINSIYSLVI